MTNFISGKELLERWNIKDFELFDHVKNGLQPYNEIGLLLLPSALELSSKSERLDELGTELEKELNYFISKSTFVGTIANLFNEQEFQMLEKKIKEFQESKGELEEIENLTSWENFALPESDLEMSKEVINSLQYAYFDLNDIEEIEKEINRLNGGEKAFFQANRKAEGYFEGTRNGKKKSQHNESQNYQ